MKKYFLLVLLAGLLTSCGTTNNEVIDNTSFDNANLTVDNNSVDRNVEIASLQPEYKADLYGKVKSAEGNIFTITEIDTSKDPTAQMEIKEKQAYMQSLSEADRLALKEQIASATLGDIKVMIPVGIPMIKRELLGEDKIDVEATLEDIKVGDVISIWYNVDITDRKVAMYVKRSLRK